MEPRAWFSFVALSAFALSACRSDSSPPKDADTENQTDANDDCIPGSPEAARGCVDPVSLSQDLTFIAKERPSGSPHWQLVQDLCKERFLASGFDVELHNYGTGTNVVGVKTGARHPSKRVIVSAHYDSTPGCEGADDNATGVAGVLQMAQIAKNAEFGKTLVVACWDEEEQGKIGSTAYARRAKEQNDQIEVMLSLEMIGVKSTAPNTQRVPAGFEAVFPEEIQRLEDSGNRGDFLALIPDTSAIDFAATLENQGKNEGLKSYTFEITDNLKSNPVASDVQRSDHAPFWNEDFPAVLITDTSEFRYDAYHCRDGRKDSVSNIDHDFFVQSVRVVVGSVVEALQAP